MLQEVEKLGQLPAACQVEPAVSSSRSSSTTSVQPSRARWYSALQPTAPPPMTTTRAWLLMQHAVATGCARHAPAPAAAPDSTLHPRARGVIEGPQRDPRGNALAGDRHESPPHALRAPLAERLEADKAPGLVPGDGELQAGLERCVLVADVVAPVPIRLFHAQAVQGMVAREAQSEGLTRTDDHVVYGLRKLGGDVQLVAQLSDIRDPARPYARVAEIDDPGGSERKGGRGQVRVGERREQLAAARPHETEHRIGRGHVECDRAGVRRNAAAQPAEIARLRRA